MLRKALVYGGIGIVVFLVVSQLIPYGRNHSNPAVVKEPAWNAPATRALAKDACFDCHSNLTTWTWYSNIAPGSWLIYNDVKAGRETLNFSEWNRAQEAGDVVEAVTGGSMPPWYYKLLHPKARLSSAERDQLARGLDVTLRRSPPGR